MIRPAKRSDVPEIIGLIANDPLGAKRENFQDPLPDTYYEAFEIIERDPHQELMVFEGTNQKVVGVFQLSFIQYLTYQGGKRAQIEGVRVHEDMRGHGLGEQIFKWVIDRAKEQGAHVLQLTTDKKRPDALRFYEKLGFTASHEGMKLHF